MFLDPCHETGVRPKMRIFVRVPGEWKNKNIAYWSYVNFLFFITTQKSGEKTISDYTLTDHDFGSLSL